MKSVEMKLPRKTFNKREKKPKKYDSIIATIR